MAAELAELSQLWRSFELKKFLEDLDHAANELLLRQSESDCSRKKLVEQSRELKKNTNEETWSIVAPLLKSFQSEIDSLSRRSRAAEAEFLKVYKKMIALPDPTVTLERAVVALQQERRTSSFGGLSAGSRQQQPDTSTALSLHRDDASSRACRAATTNGHSGESLSRSAGCLDPKNLASGGARTNHSCSTLVRSGRSESAPEKVRRLPATQSADEDELRPSPQPQYQQEESWRSKDLSRLSVAEHTLAVMKSALEKAQVELLEMKRRYGGAASPSSSPRRDESERSCSRIRQGSCEGCQCRLSSLVDRGAGGNNSDCSCNKTADRSSDSCCETLPPRCDERVQPVPQSSSAPLAFDKIGLPERLPPEETDSLLQEQATCSEPRIAGLCRRPSGSAAASDRGTLLSIRPHWAARFLDPSGLSAHLHDENSCDSSFNGAAIADGCTTNRRHISRSTDRTGRTTPTPSREVSVARGYESPTGSAGSYGGSIGADLLSRACYSRELDYPTDTHGDHSKEVLDTADVSSRVKEILSNNSIGQRLFAKQVLGLSQGTVSELLSKPKHWDKLTEKGRESYRKMNQWLSDQHNVDALKSQSPRRSGPVSSAKSDAASTEERIGQILREAQAAMQLRQLEEQSMRQPQQMLMTTAAGVSAAMAIQPSSELLTAESIGRQVVKHRSLAPSALPPPPPTPPGTVDTQRLRDAALSEAMVSRIYEEELLKLALQASLAGNSTDYALYQAELRRLSEKRWWTGDRERPIAPASVSPATSAADAAAVARGGSAAGEQRPAAYSDEEDCNAAPAAAVSAAWVSASVGSNSCSAPIGSDLPLPAHGHGSLGSREGAGSRDRLALQQQPLPPSFPSWPPLQTVKHEPPDEADNGSRHESPTPSTGNPGGDADSDLSAPQDEPVDFTMDRRRTEQQQQLRQQPVATDQPQHRLLPPSRHWPLLPSELSSADSLMSPGSASPSVSQPQQLQQQLLQKDGRFGEGDEQRVADLGSAASGVTAAAAASPLLKMQTVAHAFLSSSQAHLLTAPQKPLRVVLPPIAQEQFERYASICTEELVGRVKKVLSDYSISQRLFGESVLGLSQGSVSDLLARPKPWSMLTQKGREPFIRMHIFIDDPLAVKRLMTNQYHHHHPTAAGQPSSLSPMQSAHSMLQPQQQHHLQLQQLPLPPDVHLPLLLTLPPQPPSNARGCTASSPVEVAASMLSRAETIPSTTGPLSITSAAAEPAGRAMQQSRMAVSSAMSASGLTGHVQPHEDFSSAAGVLAGAGFHRISALSSGCRIDYSPTSAMPTLDTLSITSRVKDVLCYHGIGQKLFGEAVLGLSQGSVSDMLSKPKPWELLSVKGREPFVKMQYWLSDPNNVERLQALQAEIKASRKTAAAADDASSDRSSPCIKKSRYSFTDEQKRVLRTAFAQDPYPTSASIDSLAQRMSLSTKTVINWFHNHRMRSKQQLREGDDHSQQQHCLTNAIDSAAVMAPRLPSIHGSGNAANTAATAETAANTDATIAIRHRRVTEQRQASRCDESTASGASAVASCGEQPDVDSSCGGASSHSAPDLGGFRCSSDDHDHADRSEGDYYEDDDDDNDRVGYDDDDMFEAEGRWAAHEGSPAAQQQPSAATAAAPDSERGSSQASSDPATTAVDGPAGTNAGFGGHITAAAAAPACPTPCAGSSSRKRKSSHPQYVHQGRDLDHRDDDAGASSAVAVATQWRLLAPATSAARSSKPSSPTVADDAPVKASDTGPLARHGDTEAAMSSALAAADRVEYDVETAATVQAAVRAAAAAARQEKLDFVARIERLIGGDGDGSGGDTDWDERPDRKGNVELLEQNLARTQATAAGDDWCI